MEAKERLLSIISPVALLVLWQLLSWAGALDPRFVPSPIGIGLAAYGLILDGELFHHVWISLLRVGAGFLVGAVPGIAIGRVISSRCVPTKEGYWSGRGTRRPAWTF